MSSADSSLLHAVIQHLLSLDHYSALADNFDKFYGYWYEPTAEVIARYLDLVPTDKLADIGAGTAGIAHSLWRIAGNQSSQYQYELKIDTLALCCRIADTSPGSGTQFRHAEES